MAERKRPIEGNQTEEKKRCRPTLMLAHIRELGKEDFDSVRQCIKKETARRHFQESTREVFTIAGIPRALALEIKKHDVRHYAILEYLNGTEFSLAFTFGTLKIDFALASEKEEGQKYGPADLSAGFGIFSPTLLSPNVRDVHSRTLDVSVHPAYYSTLPLARVTRFRSLLLQSRYRVLNVYRNAPADSSRIDLQFLACCDVFHKSFLAAKRAVPIDPLLQAAMDNIPIAFGEENSHENLFACVLWAITVVIVRIAEYYGVEDDAWNALALLKEKACSHDPEHILRFLPVRKQKNDAKEK